MAKEEGGLSINKSSWEEVKEGVDYTETYKEIDVEKEEGSNFDAPSFNFNWSGLKYVFYVIVVGLVLFLVIKILSNLTKNPTIKKQDISIESIEEIEEKMHEIDLDLLLEEALLQKNYHVALRINFLIIIKTLSEQGTIIWAKEKTNWEYYSEIKEVIIKDGFKSVILAFEPIWYGEHLLTKEGFNKLQPLFDNFKNKLTTNE
ncbi:MAG: hypothetical protein JKX68_14025 [Flavobacteriales bacterium]|nr:hypothetical protein [Flavobacteriales bacterium]